MNNITKDNIIRLLDVDLLNEFSSYGKNLKAERVYKKCLINKKFELAKKINYERYKNKQ